MPELGNASAIADAIRAFERPKLECELCGATGHVGSFHDTEIVEWLSADPAGGQTNGRAYYAYKRREKGKKYPGFRKDVWAMMQTTADRW